MKKRFMGALALGTAGLLALAGCASDGSGGTSSGGSDNGSSASGDTIKVSYIAGWTDGQSIAYLLKDQLEKKDFKVEVDDLTDNGPMYAGLSQGDIDLFASAWPEVTQASYMEEFGDKIEDLGTWYEGATLTIAVPSYSKLNSIDELKDNADLFGSEIIGIEPGAGLTGVTEDSMIPEYELEDTITLSTSSTATMLTMLGEAIDKKEEIVVTLWRPFWANSAYDVKDLEDPKGAMGEAEGLHILARDGFKEDYADLADLIEQIKLDDDAYGALEELVTSDEYENDSEGAVSKWIEDNADAFPGLLK
ncbi:glycine betaine ABC transporter substrate-binding protein [Leucobacter sp. UCMA 4100]|uniref:glycine betaine ABC transporter substrate-binding protein n=1 Tax=Leucobacter TaxID=55968 RepID=UPI001C22A100|nr:MULTISPECIES: glycine betaine ABC transporter substrate-binding protein [Leucobacter]MDA3146659.1 glycine betaine ABC transporter substrate-binding protein [Leucobacter sp. UCMA 4100]